MIHILTACSLFFLLILGEPLMLSLRVSEKSDLYLQFTEDDALNALLMLRKFESFCLDNEDLLREDVKSTTVSYCIDYVRRMFCNLIDSRSIAQLNSLGHIGVASKFFFMEKYEMMQGAYDFHFFRGVMAPKQIIDSRFQWRTSVALIVPVECNLHTKNIDDLALLHILLPSIQSSLRDEIRLWTDLSLYLGVPGCCPIHRVTALIKQRIASLGIPFTEVHTITTSDTPPSSCSSPMGDMERSYGSLIAAARADNMEFYFLLQDSLHLATTNWLWIGVSSLMRSDYLPNNQGFGCVIMQGTGRDDDGEGSSSGSCDDEHGDGRQCPTAVVLAKSHVDMFPGTKSVSLGMASPSPPHSQEPTLSPSGSALYWVAITLLDLYSPFLNSALDIDHMLLSVPLGPTDSTASNISEEGGDAVFAIPSDTAHKCTTCPMYTHPIFTEEFPFEMFRARHTVAAWLHQHSPYGPSLVYADSALVYGPEGRMFDWFSAENRVLHGAAVSEGIRLPEEEVFRQVSATEKPHAKVAVITAVFGGYEVRLHRFAEQSVPTDFICFTDMDHKVSSRGWIIDHTPYHLDVSLPTIDTGKYVNSLKNNKHPMNIGKFYKQFFFVIPRMKKYDHVIWIDGSIRLESPHIISSLQRVFSTGHDNGVVAFEHDWRDGSLEKEVRVSGALSKYNSTVFNGIAQPLQDVHSQYQAYVQDGYADAYWRIMRPHRPQYGVWLTCFIGFDMTHPHMLLFLQNWYLQTLMFSTQDQVGLSFVAQMMSGVGMYSLPDRGHVNGTGLVNSWYTKHNHGT
jgi:hypothetical protein